MPRSKATGENKIARPSVKKSPAKKKAVPKKPKKVVVDVIADEPAELIVVPERESESQGAYELGEKGRENNKDIDQQNEFFSRLASEVGEKRGGNPDTGIRPKHLGLYRRLVWKFVILTAVIIAVIAYFSFSQLTVSITSKGETLSDTLLLRVGGTATSTELDDSPRQMIDGQVQVIEASSTKQYQASGQEFGSEEISGTVRVINNYNKSQSLVATTRLLSPDNKLFRLKDAVTVPAGGQVTAEIYAEKPSADLAIGPTSFTIPGLWLGLQDKIYARSDQPFVFQQKIKRFVNPSDIQKATVDIRNSLTAKAQAATTGKGGDWLYDAGDPISVSFDAKPAEAKENFTATAQGRVIAVSFSREQAAKLAGAKLNLLVPDDKYLVEFKPENISYSLDGYNPQDGSATIKAAFSGTMTLKGDSDPIDRKRLVNLSRAQIESYLQNFPEIEKYELRFSPRFVQRAPGLVDRIKVKINEGK